MANFEALTDSKLESDWLHAGAHLLMNCRVCLTCAQPWVCAALLRAGPGASGWWGWPATSHCWLWWISGSSWQWWPGWWQQCQHLQANSSQITHTKCV
jgi:hypothetical protein